MLEVVTTTKLMIVTVFVINSYGARYHWPKELLIWHCTVLSLASGAISYDCIVTNSINCLLIGSRCIPNGTHTNYC